MFRRILRALVAEFPVQFQLARRRYRAVPRHAGVVPRLAAVMRRDRAGSTFCSDPVHHTLATADSTVVVTSGWTGFAGVHRSAEYVWQSETTGSQTDGRRRHPAAELATLSAALDEHGHPK